MNKTILSFVAFMACLCALGANVYTNSFVKDGVTYVQRGGLTVKDYVVTNVVGGIGGGNVESVNGQTGVVVISEVNSATNWINKPLWIEDNWATLANEANYSTEAGHVPWNGIEEKPDWIGNTKPTYTAADVGALPVNNTDIELNFGILYGQGITLGGAHYNDDYPGRVGLKPGTASFFGAGLEVKGRISLTKNSEFPKFGNGELLVNGTNVMDAIAAVDSKVENAVLPTNPAFSNAVLAVGLNIDTNSVAVLNEIAETFGGFPIGETATTVGGLLAALAAAVAWLKSNKADQSDLDALAAKVDAANAALEEVA